MSGRNRPAILTAVITFIIFIVYLRLPVSSSSASIYPLHVSQDTLHGQTIMPKLGNETIKAELGRASWKLFHTMLSRFPETPSVDERDALKSYLHLFARLYPCGECAGHFQKLLRTYPPQTSSREAASQWGCSMHNHVNARLGKPEFDCGTIADKYKCGCADVEDGEKEEEGLKGSKVGQRKQGKGGEEKMKLEREGLTSGG